MEIVVTFPGGKRVDAQVGRFTIHTDQSPEHGGDGSAPEPFGVFLASVGACAGLYVAAFCGARNIPTGGICLVERAESDPQTGRLVRVTLEVHVPPGFPRQYRDAVARAAAACKVKRTILDPPAFEISTVVDEVHVPSHAA
jgi:ribosomal protein S12 methylthiotransferase accessory factor